MDQRVRGSLGNGAGEAMAACLDNCAEAHSLAFEASPLYQPLAELGHEGFTGTVAELRVRLDSMVSQTMRGSVHWPKAPNALGNALRRMVSVFGTSRVRKRPSVAVSSRQ